MAEFGLGAVDLPGLLSLNPIREGEKFPMNTITRWLKVGVVSSVILITRSEGLATNRASSAESAKPAACASPEYRQLDFWVGDWDVFEVDGSTKVAGVRVDRVLDGCVLREVYSGTNGLTGQSVSLYDASRRIWHQTWVTNRGQLLIVEGKIQADEMVLSGAYQATSGEETQVRGTWKPVNGGVRETAVTSTDGGKEWKRWFDLVFRPAANPVNNTGASDEGKIVAALDTQYQAAVQRNDADAMDRILADDFVLVTGSGKTYTKTDLLNEAHSERVVYERQDDSAQTVRVWGVTAVVTAKLWAKGTENGKPFEYTLWFSDTYVRTPGGWRYVFGQASLPLLKNPVVISK